MSIEQIIFADLSTEELGFISRHLFERNYDRGEIIIQQGTLEEELFMIKSGKVSVHVTLPGNSTKITSTLGEGQIFGEVGFLGESQITSSIIAESPVTCLVFNRNVLSMVRTAFPEAAYKIERAVIMQTIYNTIENVDNINHLLLTIPSKHKIKSEHAIKLPDSDARCTSLDITNLNQHLLTQLKFFQKLSRADIQTLFTFMTSQRFDKGYHFNINQHTPGSLYLIFSGAVMLFMKHNRELSKSVAVFGTGDVFMQNFFSNKFSLLATYVTCEECIVLELSRENYRKLQQLYPEIFYTISHYIHSTFVNSLYIVNRQFVRINSEFHDVL